MKKIYKKLTQEQIERGIVFTSTLSEYRTEQSSDFTHEVVAGKEYPKIDLLLNDKFFNNSHWKFNIIRR